MTDREHEALIERGAKMAEVLDSVGETFIKDDAHVLLDCKRVDALACAAAHKLGRDKAAIMAEFVRAGLAQCNGLGLADADESGGYDKFGRIAYATVSLAIELGVQAVSAGLGAGLLGTDGNPTGRLLMGDRVAAALDAATRDGSLLYADLLPGELWDALRKWREARKEDGRGVDQGRRGSTTSVQ